MTNNQKFCAPDKINNKFTCFSFQALKKIAKTWNYDAANKDNLIDNKLIDNDENDQNKYELWKDIQLKLAKTSPCTEDYCLLDNKYLSDIDDTEIIYETFRPPKPEEWYKNKNAWLSTTDIQHVLLQYENLYPEFEFIGPVPIDFDKKISLGECIVNELCNLDIEKLYNNGKRKLGIVFNLDPHDMPGSHWVSLFVNMKTGGIYFYDSVGKFPTKEISDLMFRIRTQGNNLIKQGKIKFNDIDQTHQIKKNIKCTNDNKYKIINTKKIPQYLEGMSVILLTKNSSGERDDKNLIFIEGVNGDSLILKEVNETNKGKLLTAGGKQEQILVKGFRLFYIYYHLYT